MVGTSHQGQLLEGADAAQDLLGVGGMHLHRRPLLLVKLARLVEDGVAHPELAHVVEQGTPLEPASPRLGHPHLGGEDVGIERHPAAVPRGIGALESTTWPKAAAISSR